MDLALPPAAASLAAFRNRHRGETIVVCGCGRSLADLPLPLRCISVGVNDVGRRFDPTYLVVLNPPRQFAAERFRHVAGSRARYLFTQRDDLGAVQPEIVRFRLGRFAGTELADDDTLPYTQNSPYVALCLAAHMGASRIGLIGVDFTDHHFFAASGTHPLAAQLPAIDRHYGALAQALRSRGIEVVNLGAQSRLTTLIKQPPRDFLAAEARARAVVSYATTPVAGVPAILARCIATATPHTARCVWARSDYGNGVAFAGDVEWSRAPREAERLLAAADLVIVHNGKVDAAHRRLLAGKPVITMAHNYRWNVDCSFVDAGFPGLVVGQYQATLPEFLNWSPVPNPIPLWETEYRPAPKPDIVTIAYTPSGRHETFPRDHRLYWHGKGYQTTLRALDALARRHRLKLNVIGAAQVSHAEALAMKRQAHIVIDECATGSYHRNSLEGLALGCVVVNGVGLLPELADVLRACTDGADPPFVPARLDTLEDVLGSLIALGPAELARRGTANRAWMERHWQFAAQWHRHWLPAADAAHAHVRRATTRIAAPKPRAATSIVIPHGGRRRLPLLAATLAAARNAGAHEIVVAEMDEAPRASELAQNAGARYVFLYSAEGFNKARTVNAGTALATAELVLWLDADLLLPEHFLDRAEAELRQRALDCLIPWTTVHYLSAEDSRAHIAGTLGIDACRPVNAYHTRHGPCGGAVLLRRRLVQDFGGMHEAFRGWGGEDNAWFHKVRVLGRAAVTARTDQQLYHLHHENSGGYGGGEHIAGNPHYQANLALLHAMRRVTEPARFLASWPAARPSCPWGRDKRIALLAAAGDPRAQLVRDDFRTRYSLDLPECDAEDADAIVIFGTAPGCSRRDAWRRRSIAVDALDDAAPSLAAYRVAADNEDLPVALIGPLSIILGTSPSPATAPATHPAATALVAAASGIGDLIRVTPLIRALARLGHRVDFLIAPDYPDAASLFRDAPEINRVICRPALAGRPPRDIPELAGTRYDLAIFSHLAAPLAPHVTAGRRHVFDHDTWLREGDSACITRIARDLGWRDAMPSPFAIPSARRFDLQQGTIALHPGCKRSWPWKRWHGFPDLAAQLAHVAIIGTEEDRTTVGAYFRDRPAWPAHAQDFTGTLSLADTAALIAQSAALIANDSGLMHLGVALGVPTFGIFGITSPAREAIPAPNMHAIAKGLACEPACRAAPPGRRDCPQHLQCLKDLTASEVLDRMTHLVPIRRTPSAPAAPRRPPAEADTLTVAVQLEGGLGDIIIASALVEALHRALGRCRIDVFHAQPDWAKFVFREARFVREALPAATPRTAAARYDITVHAPQFVQYEVRDSAKLERLNPGAAARIRAAIDRFASYRGLADRRPLLDGLWGRLSVARSRNVFANLGFLGGLPEAERLTRFLAPDPAASESATRLVGTAGRYITVHDGFDTSQNVPAGAATKCWPIEHWARFVADLRAAVPEIAVVQLGAGKSRPIPGVDACLIGRTSLPEAAWIIKHAALHVDTDSGLTHLAHALHTRAVVLFGPTDQSFYGYPDNTNLAGDACGNCWWSTPDWLARCPRGLAQPECMATLPPSRALAAARRLLQAPAAPGFALVAQELYGRDDADLMAEMFARLGLAPVPITQHAADAASGLYVHASKQWEYPFVLRQIAAHARHLGPLAIADIGGGRGALAAYLARSHHRVDVFDRDYHWDDGGDPDIGRRYVAWAETQGYAARFGSLYNLPAEDAAYDVVVSVSVIEHVPAKPLAMRELLRLVRPGGLLIMTFDYACAPARFQDRLRVEIFDPGLLAATLARFDIAAPDFDAAAIAASAAAIQRDGVLGIPDGMTVAGIALRRAATA